MRLGVLRPVVTPEVAVPIGIEVGKVRSVLNAVSDSGSVEEDAGEEGTGTEEDEDEDDDGEEEEEEEEDALPGFEVVEALLVDVSLLVVSTEAVVPGLVLVVVAVSPPRTSDSIDERISSRLMVDDLEVVVNGDDVVDDVVEEVVSDSIGTMVLLRTGS